MMKDIELKLVGRGGGEVTLRCFEDGEQMRNANIITFTSRGTIRVHTGVNKDAGFQRNGAGQPVEADE